MRPKLKWLSDDGEKQQHLLMDIRTTWLDDERRYVEGLLKERFNFYLVFIALFLGIVFDPKSVVGNLRIVAMFVGGVVSLLMALSVTRTYRLVLRILEEIKNCDIHRGHPFRRISEDKTCPRQNAYLYLILVAWFVTFSVIVLAGWSTLCVWGIGKNSFVCVDSSGDVAAAVNNLARSFRETSARAPSLTFVGSVGPFESGKATLLEADASVPHDIVKRLLPRLTVREPILLIVAGSADKFELPPHLRAEFGSNSGLARARADWVGRTLAEVLEGRGIGGVVYLPLTTGSSKHGSTLTSKDTRADRIVSVYSAPLEHGRAAETLQEWLAPKAE